VSAAGRHPQPRRIGVVAKRASADALRTARALAEWLRRRGLDVFLDRAILDDLGGGETPWSPETACDLVIALGGDGTLLAVARALAPGVPIFGVNVGNLGFLTEVGRADLYPAIEQILLGRFDLEARALLAVERRSQGGSGGSERYVVLNDVVVTKSALSRIIELTIEVDGHLVASYRSDGLIISTPTGSTAYNLSAGGPILHPLLPVTVLTPICPHALSLRPLVVPASSRIEVTLETQREEVYMTLDGQTGTELRYRDVVAATSSSAVVHLVKVAGRSFYDNLREKLRWGGLDRPAAPVAPVAPAAPADTAAPAAPADTAASADTGPDTGEG
jgi:NAD+ kinase